MIWPLMLRESELSLFEIDGTEKPSQESFM